MTPTSLDNPMRMRLLFIHRYRSPAMHRKAVLLAERQDIAVRSVFPRTWRDEYGEVRQTTEWARGVDNLSIAPVEFLGRTGDPHRATYRTLTFGMPAFRPDIILAEDEPDSIAALHVAAARAVFAPRARLVLYTWQNQARPLGRAVRLVQATTLHAADAVICANTEATTLLRRFGFRGPCPVIPANGVDASVFQPRKQVVHAVNIGYVGRLAVEKGIEDLLDAFAALREPNAHLTLVGDGPQRAALERHAAQLDVRERVTFAGPLAGSALTAAYHGMSMLVLPSRTTPVWKEQFGRVLIEAMACGVPVIGSDSGAIPEVIAEAGLVFPEGDIIALTNLIRRIAIEPTLASSLTQRGIERVATFFTQEALTARTADFLKEIA